MGPNHIDARLGLHCNYGVLDPLFRALPPAPGSGVWDPHSLGSQGMGVPGNGGPSSLEIRWNGVWAVSPRPWDPGSGANGLTANRD